MKIKVNPEDFIVEELNTISLSSEPGKFRVYRLLKKGAESFGLMETLSERLNVPEACLSIGGIKDRHGLTGQYISVENNNSLPHRINGDNFKLEEAGFSNKPATSSEVTGNSFRIVLRDIECHDVVNIINNFNQIQKYGIPNYFDDQRFGSSRHGKGFIGKEIFLGNREQALKLYFQYSDYDGSRERNYRKFIIDHWGDWKTCLKLNKGIYAVEDFEKIIRFLAQDGYDKAFNKALSLINHRMLTFIICAYRSYLFNLVLSKFITELCRSNNLLFSNYPYKAGEFIFYRSLNDNILNNIINKELPEPAYDTVISDDITMKMLNEVLEGEGLSLSELKVRQIYGVTVHGKSRKIIVIPENMEIISESDDELYAGKKKLEIKFDLAKASYATILIKMLDLK